MRPQYLKVDTHLRGSLQVYPGGPGYPRVLPHAHLHGAAECLHPTAAGGLLSERSKEKQARNVSSPTDLVLKSHTGSFAALFRS